MLGHPCPLSSCLLPSSAPRVMEQSRGKDPFQGVPGTGVGVCCSKGHLCPQGYVCYKPLEQRACYLRRMDPWDLQTLQMALNTSEHSVSSCCSIPGMSGGCIELCICYPFPQWLLEARGSSPYSQSSVGTQAPKRAAGRGEHLPSPEAPKWK